MKDKHYYSFIIAALFLFFLLDAFVATAISSGKDTYFIQKFDKNEDGKLSQQEYPGSDTSFNNRDKNNDGYIDENEAHKGPIPDRQKREKRGGGYIQHFDRDKDGKVSREEYRGSDTAFDNWDKNNDGYIDENEAHKGPMPDRRKREKRGGGYIQHFDKDKDGKLSKEEYPGSDSSFNNRDENNDGYIDSNEIKKGRPSKTVQQRI